MDDTSRWLPPRPPQVFDHREVIEDLKHRLGSADLPDPVFALFGALDLAVRVPLAAGRYYEQLVEHGHARLVEVGAQRAVHRRVSRMEQVVTPTARRWAVRHSQRQRRRRRERTPA